MCDQLASTLPHKFTFITIFIALAHTDLLQDQEHVRPTSLFHASLIKVIDYVALLSQIFCKTKSMCDQLASSLPNEFRSAALHGDKMQRERDYVLAAFKRVSVCISVCLIDWKVSTAWGQDAARA